MEHSITKEDIAKMTSDELKDWLYEVECDIHSITFSFTHDGISEGTAVYEDMRLELKELRDLHEALMDEIVIRSEK